MKQLYSPKQEPMNVFVFFSGGASSLKAMVEDPNYGKLYSVVGAYTDKEDAKGRQLCKEHEIPDLFMSRKEFYKRNNLKPNDWDSRKKLYEMLAGEISICKPDVICLSGYMHIVTEEIHDRYLTLNVHPADLSILSGPGCVRLDVSDLPVQIVRKLAAANNLSRKYKGEESVLDAIMSGERETRSTIHIATKDFDEGMIVVQSKAFQIDINTDSSYRQHIPEYAQDLQNKMKIEGDGPAYLMALELISHGRLSTDNEILFMDGKELPYCGFRLAA